MNVTVIHREADADAAGTLKAMLDSFSVETEMTAQDRDWADTAALEKRLKAGAWFVALLPEERLESPWLAWLAGCTRRQGGLVAVGMAQPDWVPFLFNHVFFAADGEAFRELLAGKMERWKQQSAWEESWAELLRLGIPWGEASFAARIREKNTGAAKLFLRGGFSPDTRDPTGNPLLCIAARAGAAEIVAILIEAGADVNAGARDHGGSALIDSALGKYLDIGKMLVEAGADLNTKSRDGQSALIISVGLEDAPFVELLLKAGANPDEPDALGASARKYAALFRKKEIMEIFEKYAPKER